jgi:hypothetical protein
MLIEAAATLRRKAVDGDPYSDALEPESPSRPRLLRIVGGENE